MLRFSLLILDACLFTPLSLAALGRFDHSMSFFPGDMEGAGSFSKLGSIPQISLQMSHIYPPLSSPMVTGYSRGVLGDGAVTGELPAAGDVVDGHLCPPEIGQLLGGWTVIGQLLLLGG